MPEEEDSRKKRIEKKIEEMKRERRTNRALVEKVSEKVITELYDTILEKEEQLDKVIKEAQWTIAKVDRRVDYREEKCIANLIDKMKEESEKMEAGLEEIKSESRSAFEFLKSNFAEFMRLQVIAEQDDKETGERRVSEVPRSLSLENEKTEEGEDEPSAETDTWSSTFIAPMQEDEEFRSTLSAVHESESESENPLAADMSTEPHPPILKLQNVCLEDSDEESSVKEVLMEIDIDENPLDKSDCELALGTFFSSHKGHALFKLALKLPDVTVSTKNALNGKTLRELFFDCKCKNKLKSFLEFFFQNFLKDYKEPSFYMRYFQALFLEDFYVFLQQHSDSTIYQWHRTIDSRFPLAFFAQVVDMTHMKNLYNYENV